jgi:hypothetical protein
MISAYAAGFVQRREWMLYKIRPDHYPINTSLKFHVSFFNLSIFKQVVRVMMVRHEILRTSLTIRNGSLKQIIHPGTIPLNYTHWDLRTKTGEEQEVFINEKLRTETYVAFNFDFAPLFRVSIFEKGSSSYLICFVFHHVISDSQSLTVFEKEIVPVFEAAMAGRVPTFEKEAVQYREYTRFENELLETKTGDRYRKYWEAFFAGGVHELSIIDADKRSNYNHIYLEKVAEVTNRIRQLPVYDERFTASVVRRYRILDGGTLVYRYPKRLFAGVSKYAENGASGLLSILIASIMLALHRLTGQKRFTFDIPASSRHGRRFNGTLGWLTAGGLCHFDLTGNLQWPGLLEHIDKQLFLLAKNCIFPFEAAICGMTPPIGGRVPAFLSMSYFDGEAPGEGDKNGFIVRESHGQYTYEEISFFFNVYSDTILLEITYNSLLFCPGTIETIIREHAAVLETL